MPRQIIARVLTCRDRAPSLTATLAQLAASDWNADPVVHLDDQRAGTRLDRINANWIDALAGTVIDDCASLILEDDVTINVHIRHNLERWYPIGKRLLFASLYNGSACPAAGSVVADALRMWGSQAIVVSPAMAAHVLAHWEDEEGFADTRMPRIASRIAPVYCHTPSLVQHVGTVSTWGGTFHQAADFDRGWRAP